MDCVFAVFAFSPFSRFRFFPFPCLAFSRFRVFVFRRRHPRGRDTDFVCTATRNTSTSCAHGCRTTGSYFWDTPVVGVWWSGQRFSKEITFRGWKWWFSMVIHLFLWCLRGIGRNPEFVCSSLAYKASRERCFCSPNMTGKKTILLQLWCDSLMW